MCSGGSCSVMCGLNAGCHQSCHVVQFRGLASPEASANAHLLLCTAASMTIVKLYMRLHLSVAIDLVISKTYLLYFHLETLRALRKNNFLKGQT